MRAASSKRVKYCESRKSLRKAAFWSVGHLASSARTQKYARRRYGFAAALRSAV